MTDTSSTAGTEAQPEYPPDNDGNKLWWLIGIVAVVLVFIVVIIVSDGIRTWFALHTGVLKGGPDPYYNFWSGIGSDIGEATLISAVGIGVYTGVRKVNCHSRRCWRIGHHALEGTPYILCRHHHPGVPNGGATHEHILNEHHKHQLAQAAEQRLGLRHDVENRQPEVAEAKASATSSATPGAQDAHAVDRDD